MGTFALLDFFGMDYLSSHLFEAVTERFTRLSERHTEYQYPHFCACVYWQYQLKPQRKKKTESESGCQPDPLPVQGLDYYLLSEHSHRTTGEREVVLQQASNARHITSGVTD
ncbi:MAG: hypothetical protein JW384_04370 [Nitrosomonadaceae bacterium]|nr:hypothetical protein [Nitrosomonadaceae bacterium]